MSGGASGSGGAGRGGRPSRRLVVASAVLVVVLVVVAVVQLNPLSTKSSSAGLPSTSAETSLVVPSQQTASSSTSPTSLSSSSSSSSSSSVVVTSPSSATLLSPSQLTLCSNLSPAQQQANAKAGASATHLPSYDEQLWLGFEQNFSSISYNVTARALNDSFGYGPVYLLNGLADNGYWYQVGVAWNWPVGGSGSAVSPGFRFLYQVWNSSSGAPVYPSTSVGTSLQQFRANDGDEVLLALTIISGGTVVMQASDPGTGAFARVAFGMGASQFVGFKDRVSRFPSSLLTEWYHVLPYFCLGEPVVYSTSGQALSSAWMQMDEWNLTGVPQSQRFSESYPGQCCVFATGYQGVGFQDPGVFQPLATNGTTVYSNSLEFVTI